MENYQELVEGFNAGYMIEKHRPELAKQLVDGLEGVEVPFVEGFIAGNSQSLQERELAKSKTISKLKSLGKSTLSSPIRNRSKDDKNRGFDIER